MTRRQPSPLTAALSWCGIFLAFLLVAWPGLAAAQPVPRPADPMPLAGHAKAWIDEQGTRTAGQVAADPAIPWHTLEPGARHALHTGRVLWVAFTVPALPEGGWAVDIDYPSVNLATLYRLHGTQAEKMAEAGDTVPVAQWPVPHRHPLLPVFRSPDAAQHYLLRIENPHAFSAPLTLVHQRTLGRSAQATTFLLGVYFGLAGLAAAVALLSAAVLRDGTYGRYVVAVLAMALAQAAATGIGGLLLWPQAARWNDLAPLLLPVLAGAAFLWFFDSAVALAQRDRRMHRGLLALAALGPVLAVGIALAEPSFRFRLQVPYVACACLAGASILFWAGRRGDRHARWMLWALLPVALTAMLPLSGTLGLLPVSAWTLHAMPVAISLELPALLVILMLRSQERREHGRRLVGLYRTDPATGLPNAPEFQERLALQIARSRRMHYQSVALLVEVRDPHRLDGFDRSDSGRIALHLAGRLLSVAREVDTVARLGEQRFGLLLEGPLTDRELEGAGQKVVARCLMPLPDRPSTEVIPVRVAQACVPRDGTDGAQLMERLHALLAAAPADAPRSVYSLDSGRAPL